MQKSPNATFGDVIRKSAGVTGYFDNPVPAVTAKNALFIRDDLVGEKYDYIVEFGLGKSTIYYCDALLGARWNGVYVAVEPREEWFDLWTREARGHFEERAIVQLLESWKTPWSMEDLRTFLAAEVTPESKALTEFQRRIAERQFGFSDSIPSRILRRLRRASKVDCLHLVVREQC